VAISETQDGWAWYRVEAPPRKGTARTWEYALPVNERERSSAQKAALRKLQRLALLHGVAVQISRRRKEYHT